MEEGNDRVRATEWISNIFSMASGAAANTLSRNRKDRDGLIVGFREKKKPTSLFREVALDFFFGGFTFFHRNIGKCKYNIKMS